MFVVYLLYGKVKTEEKPVANELLEWNRWNGVVKVDTRLLVFNSSDKKRVYQAHCPSLSPQAQEEGEGPFDEKELWPLGALQDGAKTQHPDH